MHVPESACFPPRTIQREPPVRVAEPHGTPPHLSRLERAFEELVCDERTREGRLLVKFWSAARAATERAVEAAEAESGSTGFQGAAAGGAATSGDWLEQPVNLPPRTVSCFISFFTDNVRSAHVIDRHIFHP